MRYIADHDYHIHSKISLCSADPAQTPEAILQYGSDSGFSTIILTDHHWDESVPSDLNEFYRVQNYAYVTAAKPLPQKDGIRFLFGCEVDLDKNLTLGMAHDHFDRFDFIIIPTTHLHMDGFTIGSGDACLERRAELWVERFDAVLNMDLPFHKIGIAHLTCSLMAPGDFNNHIVVLNMIPDEALRRLFTKAAGKGVGIELNFPYFNYEGQALESILRIYRTAKDCGCKFYFGSDAHHPAELSGAKALFEAVIDALGLTEEDKFKI